MKFTLQVRHNLDTGYVEAVMVADGQTAGAVIGTASAKIMETPELEPWQALMRAFVTSVMSGIHDHMAGKRSTLPEVNT